MPAWVEDAQQLTELRDLSSSQSSVLLRTTEVEEFLSNLNLSSHALVAPKGFGKTLVLKLKRISLQENDYRCFPFSPIVDRPIIQVTWRVGIGFLKRLHVIVGPTPSLLREC